MVSDVLEEIEYRSYIRDPKVAWDETLEGTVVEFLLQGFDADKTRAAATEELFEIVAAVLGDVKAFKVQNLDVTPHA